MIAVTGLACRFPGATDATAFWDLILNGRSGLARFTAEELRAAGVPDELANSPGYVPVGGLIDGQDEFDPLPFGLTDAEATLMDPQQRLFLTACWQALELAGHGGGAGAGAVGVYAGASHSAYLTHNLAGRWDPTGGGADPIGSLRTAIATHTDYLPLQVAYRLGLSGPAMAINSTCSSSLVAVHIAAQALLAEECDTALAGGVSLIVPQGHGYRHVPDGIYSRDGAVRPYSADGSGIVYSQGAGVVVLRRLDDALADGDPVLAVLHGSAVNNDGATKAGFTAPSLRGQSRVIAEAHAVAGVTPRQVGYVEGHGTATALGDPIEVAALSTVFGRDKTPWCGLGSVKANIGHTNTAAGIASLIKTVLARAAATVPPSPHAEPVNPRLGLTGSAFDIPATPRPWPAAAPFAGISSFGIGGTNCHLVLGPAPAPTASPSDPRPQTLMVSGHDEASARAGAAALAGHLAGVPDSAALADLAHTLDAGRTHHRHRIAVVSSPADVTAGAAALREARPIEASTTRPSIIFAFPGAGSQYPGMGSSLYDSEPVFTRTVDDCATALRLHTRHDVRDLITGRAGQAQARDAAIGLPALFTVSLATARLLESWGVRPDVVLGHSLGEYSAAVVSGGLALPDAARLVSVRCAEVARAAGAGAMLSLDLPVGELAPLLAEHPEVDLAAVNGPAGCVVSGAAAAIDALAVAARAAAVRSRRLHVDAALHSRLVEPAMDAVRAAAADLPDRGTDIRLVSTLTGTDIDMELGTADHWARQLREPVLFSPALLTAVGAGPAVVVQVGPGTSLVTLTRAHAASGVRDSISTLDHDRLGTEPQSIRAVPALLWAHGAEGTFARQRTGRRTLVAAPGYAFQPRRLWIDPPAQPVSKPTPVSAVTHLPRWRQLPPQSSGSEPIGHFLLVATNDSARRLATELLDDASGTRCRLSTTETLDRAVSLDGVVVLTGPSASTVTDTIGTVTEVIEAHADLARRLADLDIAVPKVLAVTLGADRVHSDDRVHPAAAAARALARVLAQELRGTCWRALDLATTADPGQAAEAVMGELAALGRAPDTDSGAELAWRSGLRWQRDLAAWPVTADVPAPTPGTTRWAVVSGGLGDVGLVVAEHLARQGMAVVITSRRAVTDLPVAARAIGMLTAEGLRLETRVLDATDPAGWYSLLAGIGEQGRLEIVVHAAGAAATTRATPLRDSDPDQITHHLGGKVGGADALSSALDRLPAPRRPGLVLLMSSAVTLLGGVGTGPYAAANAALDALATERSGRAGDTRWLSVAWDGWRVGPGGTRREVALHDPLDVADGTQALDLLLRLHHAGAAPAVVAVSRTDLEQRRTAAAFTPAVVPDDDGERLTDPVARRVAELWSELFATPVRSSADDFFALGGHSLLATGMIATLTAEFGVDLRLADLLAAPTVAGLADLLRTRDCAPVAPEPTAMLGSGPESFDLTRVQHAYWIGRDGGYRWGSVPCHFFLEYDCTELDLARYELAWNQVIARHPMLRAIVDPQGKIRVLSTLPRYRVRTHDLRRLSEEDTRSRLSTLRDRISLDPGPADRWPLFTVQAALLPDGTTRLFMGVDVLICDAASWWILDRDLRARYTDPDRELPPVGVHPADCVRALDARRHGAEWERSAAYWRARLPNLPDAPSIPYDSDPDSGAAPRFVRHSETLGAAAWKRLRSTAARHRVTPTAVLLTVYADVLADWCGDAEFSVMLTLFDRPAIHPDVTKVVGDFTSLVLHATDRTGARSFAERAKRTQQRLFSDLDHREFSALDVLAERSTAMERLVSVPVVFTSALGLTEVIGAEHDPRWIGRKVSALSQTPQTLLDHQVVEEGGELLLQWDVLEPVVSPAAVTAAIAAHAERVRRLADEPASWTAGGHDDADIALLLREGGPAGRTVFLLHPSGGDVLCYAELARLLDPSVTVVAVADPGLSTQASRTEIPQDVAALAELYCEVIRRYQREGPYLLGGWSLGGDLAQRVACLLHEAGQHTELLVLLDSNSPEHITAITTGDPGTEIRRRYLDSLRGYLDLPDAATLVRVEPTQHDVDAALHDHGLLRRAHTAADRVEVFARHLHGLAAYRPSRLEDPHTHTLVVKAAQRSPVNSGIGMGIDDVPGDPDDLGWTPHLTRPPVSVQVQAHHYNLLRGDAVTKIADLLNSALADLDSEGLHP